MASIDDGELYLCAEGASEADLQQAIKAVRSVLNSAGMSAENAVAGNMARDILIDTTRSIDELSADDRHAVAAWDRALDAVKVHCPADGWIDLGLVRELDDVEAELDCGPQFAMPVDDDRQMDLI